MLELNHKKLEVYKEATKLVMEIYKSTREFPSDERYGVSQQLRRAAVSILSNIAEGSSRISFRERLRFYEIARGSLIEVDAQLEISKSLNYLPEMAFNELNVLVIKVFKLLCGMMKN